jgi:LysM repeat protein
MKSACVLLVWCLALAVIMTAGVTNPARPRLASASARTASSTQITLAAAQRAARPAGPHTSPARRYVVQPGDSLSGIAATLGVPGGWPALYAANQAAIGPDPDLIRPATVLVLPGPPAPARYTIAAGDNLSAIAAALGVPGGWPALYAANRAAIGPDPDLIRPGTVLTITTSPAPGQHPAPPPPPPAAQPRPGHHPAPNAHHRHPTPRPATTHARAASGMPPWLKTLLIAVAVIIAVAFLTEPVLIIRRKRHTTPPPTTGTKPATNGSAPATHHPAPAANGSGPAPATTSPTPPPPNPQPPPPGPGRPAAAQRIVLVDSDRLIVVRSTDDGTIYVLRPPGADPAAIMHVARLVLPEFRYGELATRFGMPPTWPIVMADYDRLIVTCSKHDGTVTVLRPPGQDPRQVLRAARLVLPEGPYGELADQLGMPANWPLED